MKESSELTLFDFVEESFQEKIFYANLILTKKIRERERQTRKQKEEER